MSDDFPGGGKSTGIRSSAAAEMLLLVQFPVNRRELFIVASGRPADSRLVGRLNIPTTTFLLRLFILDALMSGSKSWSCLPEIFSVGKKTRNWLLFWEKLKITFSSTLTEHYG